MSLSTSVQDIVEQSSDPLLGMHPSWSRVPLSKVARVQNGYPFPSSAFVSGNPGVGTPLIRIRDVMRHRTDTSFVGDFDPAFLVDPGSLLIGMDGDFNTAIWKGPPALLNQRVCRVTTDERVYSSTFLSYVLPGYLAAINAATSSITVKHLSSKSVEAIPLPLPPLPEQHRIVAAIETHLTRLDAAVAALERARARLKRYRAAVLKAACEGRLVPTEAALAGAEGRPYEPAPALLARIQEQRTTVGARFIAPACHLPVPMSSSNTLPALPEGWAWTTMGAISDVQGGIQKQPKRAPVNNAYPFLRVANVPRGRLDLSDVHRIELFGNELARLRLQPGDLLIVEGNGSAAEIGRMAIWAGAIDDCVHQNHLTRARLAHGVLPSFVESYWNSPDGTSRVLNVASSTSGLHTLSVGKINGLPVPLPPFAEQERIVAEVERRLSVLYQLDAAVTANLKRADALRQSVLRRAFSGRLV